MSVPELIPLDFEVDEGLGSQARIGLIVLESDQTLEAEARLIRLDGVEFYHARIANELEVNHDTLTDMIHRLPQSAALLPPEFDFDAIGYGCTSASTLLGPEAVGNAIAQAHEGVPSTNPISAAVAAFRSLGAQRIAVVTPYSAEVTAPIADHLVSAGFEVTGLGSFLESSDLVVGRISPASIAAGVRTVVAQSDCDAVFVSCTSLRLVEAVAELELEVGLPVVSSNLAMLWHLVRLAGVEAPCEGLGRLFGVPLAAN